MADTAAFFAQKKLKKKKFKAFNANKIDASAVVSAQAHHVDAPEISVEDVTTSLGGLSSFIGGAGGDVGALSSGDDQWADTQGGGWGNNKKKGGGATTAVSLPGAAAGADSKVAELLDMQALSAKRNVEDDVAERLRIEETKAALARAKEGMAKEAERLAAEKAEKEARIAARAEGMQGGANGGSSLGGGTGGKWVPSFRSNGSSTSGSGSSIRGPASMGGGVGAGFQKSVDMSNDELFPDLAAADQILAEKERQLKAEQDRMASSQPTKAPDGWGSGPRMSGPATSASSLQRKPLVLTKPSAERKPLNLAPPSKKKEEVVDSEPIEVVATKEEGNVAVDTAPIVTESQVEGTITAESTGLAPQTAAVAAVTSASAATTAPASEKAASALVLKKKKKKDLSTFKAKS